MIRKDILLPRETIGISLCAEEMGVLIRMNRQGEAYDETRNAVLRQDVMYRIAECIRLIREGRAGALSTAGKVLLPDADYLKGMVMLSLSAPASALHSRFSLPVFALCDCFQWYPRAYGNGEIVLCFTGAFSLVSSNSRNAA